MGVTDHRLYFTRIIGHNSMNFHRISTKRGTEIRRNEPFSAPNFSSIGVHIRVLWQILQSVQKKVEEKTPKLRLVISWNGLGDFLQIL